MLADGIAHAVTIVAKGKKFVSCGIRANIANTTATPKVTSSIERMLIRSLGVTGSVLDVSN